MTEGDLFAPYQSSKFNSTVILANLPYVPNDYAINQAAMNEPKQAIFGGVDGLDLYRQLCSQLADAQASSVTLLTESLPFQHEELRTIAHRYGFSQQDEQDFIQNFIRL